MTYAELKESILAYKLDEISRDELICHIALWQRKEFGEVAE